jgi:protein-S-isoprenylcysteine O-methyltransferase Ste14
MRGILNIIIIVLIVGWLLGYIGFGAVVGNLIHLLLVCAVIAIILRLVSK